MSISLFLSILLCCVTTANTLGNETDRLALHAFKSGITQDLHGVVNSWNDSYPFCQWKGVVCSHKHQRVTVLNLKSNGLAGPISPHLGNLSFLRRLDLSNNSFTGKIPSEFGKLFRLEILSVSYNSLTGGIPVNLSLCTNLMELHIHFNNLTGNIPTELGYFPKLSVFNLAQNMLSGNLPPSLGNLTTLKTLVFTTNNLGGMIPNTLGQLKRLKYLSFAANGFSGVFPPSIYNLSALEMIANVKNQLSGSLPTEIGHMLPNLQQLLIGINQFSGSIPTSLFNNSNLQLIDVGENQFGGKINSNVGNLKDLQALHLHKNNFGSRRPGDLDFLSSLTNCSNLWRLSLSFNQFGGTIPTSIGNFSNTLTYLNLNQNQISGNIPLEIGNIRNLYALSLGFNHLTGSIPRGIVHLQKLQGLDLDFNLLSGHVPSFTRNMSDLYFLHLNNNKFEGNISSVLDNQNVQYLYLSDNNFSGRIPTKVGTLKNLKSFDISHNKLSGKIPNTIASSKMLLELSLEDNLFYGPIPSSLSSLQSLQVLDISHNNISGTIPKDLGMLPSLQYLNLSFNNLEGEVPTGGLFRNASAFSVLGNEKICGGISELRFQKCRIDNPKKKQAKHMALKVTLSVFIPTFLVTLIVVLYLRKKPKAKPVTKGSLASKGSLEDCRRFSFMDLYRATNEFSSTNLIGVGRYGSVYKGVVQKNEGLVAIKVFKLRERGASKSFMAECRTLREIRHRNLLKILTACSSVDLKGRNFKALIFEYMPNGSLENWLHPSANGHLQENLSLYQMLDIAIDVALALDYLHNHSERPIVHCDLKPSNVLLGDDMTAHVGDFGLAKFLRKSGNTSQSIGDKTDSFGVRGTIGYIPPEYGMGAEVSTQGDVYSYGILILEMFTGKRPTDNMFKEGFTLRDYCITVLPDQVMDIIDMRMLSGTEAVKSMSQIKECLSSVMNIGVACSTERVTERMGMNEVVKEMQTIRKAFHVFPAVQHKPSL